MIVIGGYFVGVVVVVWFVEVFGLIKLVGLLLLVLVFLLDFVVNKVDFGGWVLLLKVWVVGLKL